MIHGIVPAPEEEVQHVLKDILAYIERIEDWSTPDYWVLLHVLDRYHTVFLTPSKEEEERDDSVMVLQRLVWEVVEAILLATIKKGGEWWRTCFLVDAGMIMYAKEALQALRGAIDGVNKSLVLRMASILLLIVKHGNPYHKEAIAQCFSHLVLAIQPKSPPSIEDKPSTVIFDAHELALEVFLVLIQSTSHQPGAARQSLLTQSNIYLLLSQLKERLSKGLKLEGVLSAMAGILSCADETAWETIIYEPSAARYPRYLPTLITEQELQDDSQIDGEVKAFISRCITAGASDPYHWLALSSADCFGPWKPERWEDGLYSALLRGDEEGALIIVSYGDRWKTILYRPCFITRRGPWYGRVLSGRMTIPSTIMDVIEAMKIELPDLRFVLGELGSKLRALHLFSTRSKREKPAGRKTAVGVPRLTGYVEKADHHMAQFDVREDFCRQRYGFIPGDRVRSRRFLSGYGTVIGQLDGRLWIMWDEDSGKSNRDE